MPINSSKTVVMFRLRWERHGLMITCYVKDNRAGFNNDFSGKLLIQFQRLYDTEGFFDIGIGLWLVIQIIHRYKGIICCEGEEGKGATFYFTLPESDMVKERTSIKSNIFRKLL